MIVNFNNITPSQLIGLNEACAKSEMYRDEVAADLIDWLDTQVTDIATLDSIYVSGVILTVIWRMFDQSTYDTIRALNTLAALVFEQGATGRRFDPYAMLNNLM